MSARLTVVLTTEEVKEACVAHVARKYKLAAKSASVSGSPRYDMLDRPMGGYDVSVSVDCEPFAVVTE